MISCHSLLSVIVHILLGSWIMAHVCWCSIYCMLASSPSLSSLGGTPLAGHSRLQQWTTSYAYFCANLKYGLYCWRSSSVIQSQLCQFLGHCQSVGRCVMASQRASEWFCGELAQALWPDADRHKCSCLVMRRVTGRTLACPAPDFAICDACYLLPATHDNWLQHCFRAKIMLFLSAISTKKLFKILYI